MTITTIDVQTGKVTVSDEIAPSFPVESVGYIIGKSVPWLRMSDGEAVKVKSRLEASTVREQMIYDGAKEINTTDELFGILKDVLSSALSSSRANELLSPED